MIMSGMMKFRKFPKMPLKVTKIRTSHIGKKNEQAMPRMMAIMTLGNKPIFLIFTAFSKNNKMPPL